MPGKLGSLVVSLAIDAAQFTAGLTKSEVQAARFASNLRRNVNDAISSTTIAFGVFSATAGAALALVSRQAENISSFKQLSEQIGDSAEAIAGLRTISATSGVAMADLGAASVKLTTNLAKTDDEGTAAGKAIKALGLNLADFKALSPVQQLEALAKALDGFADGSGKTAAATALLGKSGAQLLPFFHDLAEAGGRNAGVTQEQIEAAENLTKAFARMHADTDILVQSFASALIPTVATMLEQFVEGKKLAGGFFEALVLFGTINPFRDVAGNIKALTEELATLQNIKSGSQFNINAALGLSTADKEIDNVTKKLAFLKFQQRQGALALISPSNNDARDILAQTKPKLKVNTNTEVDNTAKRILDGQLRAQENAIKAEQDLLSSREQFLSGYYSDDLLSVRDYYAARTVALQESTRNQSAAYDNEIQALLKFAKAAPKAEDRIEANNKISDIFEKNNRLQQESGAKAIQLTLDEARAIKALQTSAEQASIALQAMQGDSVGAAARQFDLANRQRIQQLELLRKSPDADDQALANGALSDLARTKDLTLARVSLAKATDTYTQALDLMGVAQARIDVAEASGAITELQALRERSDLAAAYVPILQQQLAVATAIAQQTSNPADIVHAKQLQQQLEALAATGDLVAKKFNDLGSGAFSQFLQDSITGAKTLKEAFLDATKSLGDSLAKIASDNIAQSLFKKGGPASRFGDALSSIFGGASDTGAAAAAAAADASLLGLSTTTITTDAALISLTASATAAAAALATVGISSAAGSAGGSFGDIFTSALEGFAQGGGLAGGTDFWRGGSTWVGENGPEIVNLPRGAQVVPSEESRRMGRGGDIHIHQTVMPGADTRSVAQAARETARAVQRAGSIT